MKEGRLDSERPRFKKLVLTVTDDDADTRMGIDKIQMMKMKSREIQKGMAPSD